MTCRYEKPVWNTCSMGTSDHVFDLSYDVLIVAVQSSLFHQIPTFTGSLQRSSLDNFMSSATALEEKPHPYVCMAGFCTLPTHRHGIRWTPCACQVKPGACTLGKAGCHNATRTHQRGRLLPAGGCGDEHVQCARGDGALLLPEDG